MHVRDNFLVRLFLILLRHLWFSVTIWVLYGHNYFIIFKLYLKKEVTLRFVVFLVYKRNKAGEVKLAI